MASFFEQTLGLDRAEMIARVLTLQTEAFGYLDVPILSRELSEYGNGDVLDIGIGDGSFLLKIAEQIPEMTFLGIEQNVELFAKARSRLEEQKLPNVQLEQIIFDSRYNKKHDVILARFTLQHVSRLQKFIESVNRTLNPNGCFVCIEPIYDYYDCEPTERIWREFREKMLATYRRWKSHPNIPKQISKWLHEADFKSIRTSVHLYSPITIGHNRFEAVVLATAAMLHADNPDIWETSFLEELEKWIKKPASDPFIAIAHSYAFKGA